MIDPNHVHGGRRPSVRLVVIEILVLAALAMAPALPSWADAQDEGTEVAAEEAAPETVPCSELSRVKYPFLTCVRGPSGRPVLAERPVHTKRIRRSSGMASGSASRTSPW